MQHWLDDTDFNGVRGAEALAKLSESERGGWQRLWEDVDGLAAAGTAEEKITSLENAATGAFPCPRFFDVKISKRIAPGTAVYTQLG